MVAKVVINTRSGAVDKVFDYNIPEGMEAKPGMRVSVPFGGGNRRMEGVVAGVVEESAPESPAAGCATNAPDRPVVAPAENPSINLSTHSPISPSVRPSAERGKTGRPLKDILSVNDPEPMCTRADIQLAFWIHKTYFCTYYDAFRLLMPPGSGIKYKEVVRLSDLPEEAVLEQVKHSVHQTAAARFLLDNARVSSLSELNRETGRNMRAPIRAMEKKGLVEITRQRFSGVRHKVEKVARLQADEEVVSVYLDEFAKKAPVQVRILELLLSECELAVSELLDGAEAGRGSLDVLVKKGLVSLFERPAPRPLELGAAEEPAAPPKLTDEQEQVLAPLYAAAAGGEFLLQGVTGSGKTEVYLSLIAHTLEQGRAAIMLVPEISLTPQTIRRFAARFGERVAVLHSGLSLGERADQWERVRTGEADVVVGARSAVFAPVQKLGVLIIDEQQEDTYVSESAPRYDAREVAAYRARQAGAVLLQASATPRVSDFYRIKNRLFLTARYNNNPLPEVTVADMREELQNGNSSIFSAALAGALRETVARGEQAILFVSRRGHSSFVSCRSCGYVFSCPNCSVSLKYHSHTGKLICHYCGYMEDSPHQCPSCRSRFVKFFGIGTQRVEEELAAQFPDLRTIRMDMDTTARRSSHQKLLDRFARREADVLLGTQMVTKGLDFPNVSLVGVLAADMMLNNGEYTAAERAFSQLTQVCGRAGRGESPGRAVIQTYQPEHECLSYAARQDYLSFYKNEIKLRKSLLYPPFCDIIVLLLTGAEKQQVRAAAFSLHETISAGGLPDGVCGVMNPVPCGVAKINNYYRWQVLVKCDRRDLSWLWRIYASHCRAARDGAARLSVIL